MSGNRVSRRLAGVYAVVDDVAGVPTRRSYTWGSRRAPLPWLVFHAVMVARLVSPLQWFKFFYRRPGRARFTDNLRRDFPAALTEWYFLVAAVALGALAASGPIPVPWVDHVISVVCWVLALECTTWILYYLFLRSFIEGQFSAYHPAEYLLQFPLVCLVQCLALAHALVVGPGRILDALRGAGDLPGAAGVTLGLLGILYTGGALAVLINALPTIRSRGSDMLAIIGAGEVTRNRILPALAALGRSSKELVVLDSAQADIPGHTVERLAPDAIVRRLDRLRVPAIVASPTRTHLDYARVLAAEGVRFAVEKPVCVGRMELDALQRSPGIMQNGFALSYFVLEKALPLTLLLTAREHYLRYVQATDGPITTSRIREIRDGLGELTSVSIRLLEGNARSPRGGDRAWTELPENGISALVETAIHPLHLVSLLTGGAIRDFDARDVRDLELGRYRPRAEYVQKNLGHGIAPTLLRLDASVGRVAVDLEVGKHIPDASTQRALVAQFVRGRIEADFDSKSATVFDSAGEMVVELAVGREFPSYAPQLGLFEHFVHHGWDGDRFDELETQLAALRMWEVLVEAAASLPVTGYDETLDLTASLLVQST